MRVYGLRHNAYVADARLFNCVHNSGKRAERNLLIGAQVNRLVLWIANLLFQTCCNLVDVDGIVAEKDSLRFVDADDKTLFGDLFHGACARHVDLNTGLQHRRGDHKDDEEDEDDIDQGLYVDIGKRGLRAAIGSSEGHQRRTSRSGCTCWRSIRISISSAKSSLRAAISRMEPMMRL